LDSGEKLIVPSSLLTAKPDGSYYAPLSLEEIRGGPTGPATLAAPQGQAAASPGPAGAAPAPAAAPSPTAPPQLAESESESWSSMVIPVIHEEIEVSKRKVETGAGVRINKSAHEEERTVDLPLVEERVEVERVPIDKAVDGPVAVRHVGDTIIVPVVEEVLVVQKQLRLVEELHIRKTRTEKHAPQTVVLRKEEATVERLEGDSRES